MEERRGFPRHSFQVEVVFTSQLLGGGHYKCAGHNICAGGINLILDRPLFEDDEISMSFILPEQRNPISLQGRVVWVQNLESEQYHAGIEFLSISVSDQAQIISYVVKHESIQLFTQPDLIG